MVYHGMFTLLHGPLQGGLGITVRARGSEISHAKPDCNKPVLGRLASAKSTPSSCTSVVLDEGGCLMLRLNRHYFHVLFAVSTEIHTHTSRIISSCASCNCPGCPAALALTWQSAITYITLHHSQAIEAAEYSTERAVACDARLKYNCITNKKEGNKIKSVTTWYN